MTDAGCVTLAVGYSHRVTGKQRDILATIDLLTTRAGHAPSASDVAAVTQRSEGSVRYSLTALERQGLIARSFGVGRSMHITPAGRLALAVTTEEAAQ